MKHRVLVAACAAFVLVSVLSGCTTSEDTEKLDGDKTTVSVLFPEELSHTINLIESTYDDIEIDFERSTSVEFSSATERQLANGQGKDIILTSQTSGTVANYTADLSSYNFSTRYQSAIMSSISKDGKTMFLPLPSNYHGIIINTTFLEQMGLSIPTTSQELLDTLRAAQQQNVGSEENGTVIAFDRIDPSAIGHLLTATMVPTLLGTIEGESWLSTFEAGDAELSPEWERAFTFFSTLSRENLADATRIDTSRNAVNYDDLVTKMNEGDLLACFGTFELLNTIKNKSSNYEFTMIPYLGDEDSANSWVTTYPLAYFALNKQLEEPGNEATLDACVRILDLLSTAEGQQALMQDMLASSSYVSNINNDSNLENSGIEDAVANGYLYYDRFPADIAAQMGKHVVAVMSDKESPSEAVDELNRYHTEGSASTGDTHTLVGSVADDALLQNYDVRRQETKLGNLVADAVAEISNAPIALVNSGGIRASLYKGDVFTDDIARVLPMANTVVVVEMSGQKLYETLQNGVSGLRYQKLPMGKFLQVSGINVEVQVDPSTENDDTPAKAEVISVALADGTPIDKQAYYTVAVNNYLCGSSGYADGGGDEFTMLNLYSPETAPLATDVTLKEETSLTYADVLTSYFEKHKDINISPILEDRIRMNGAVS